MTHNSSVGIRYRDGKFEAYVIVTSKNSKIRTLTKEQVSTIPFYTQFEVEEEFVEFIRPHLSDNEYKIVLYKNGNFDELLKLLRLLETNGLKSSQLYECMESDGSPRALAEQYLKNKGIEYSICEINKKTRKKKQ